MPELAWLPAFTCPRCEQPVDVAVSNGATSTAGCVACGAVFRNRSGVLDFLLPDHARGLDAFLEQYRRVRTRDGHRTLPPDYYQRLPDVPVDHPQRAEWMIRRETFDAVRRRVLPTLGHTPLAVLDLGAGNGWFTHQLTRLGHHAVAVDLSDDEGDGLGARTHYDTSFVCVRADFDRLPFAPAQFNLVVFTGSLHYSPDVAATLRHVARLLTPGGAIVALDSPTFRYDEDGRAMVSARDARFRHEYGLRDIVQRGVGYVTPSMLKAASDALQLKLRFFPSTGSVWWAARRWVGVAKIGRPAARFGMWVAR